MRICFGKTPYDIYEKEEIIAFKYQGNNVVCLIYVPSSKEEPHDSRLVFLLHGK